MDNVYIVVKKYINGRNIMTTELLGAYKNEKIAEKKMEEYKKRPDKYCWYSVVEMPVDKETKVKVSF